MASDKLILELKEKHSISLNKDHFSSFVQLRPHIDKLIQKCILGPLTLSNETGPPEMYTEDNKNYDDPAFIQLCRYARFLQYLSEKLDCKAKFTIMDVVDTNSSHMRSLMRALSSLATLATDFTPKINEILSDIATSESSNASFIKYYEEEKASYLSKFNNRNDMLAERDKDLQRQEDLLKKHVESLATLDENEMLRRQIDREVASLEKSLEVAAAEDEAIDKELRALRQRLVDNPEELVQKIANVQRQAKEVDRKREELSLLCCENAVKVETAKRAIPFQGILLEKIALAKDAHQRLLQTRREIAALGGSRAEEIAASRQAICNAKARIDCDSRRLEAGLARKADLEAQIAEKRAAAEASRKEADRCRQRRLALEQSGLADELAANKRTLAAITARHGQNVAALDASLIKSGEELLDLYQAM